MYQKPAFVLISICCCEGIPYKMKHILHLLVRKRQFIDFRFITIGTQLMYCPAKWVRRNAFVCICVHTHGLQWWLTLEKAVPQCNSFHLNGFTIVPRLSQKTRAGVAFLWARFLLSPQFLWHRRERSCTQHSKEGRWVWIIPPLHFYWVRKEQIELTCM